MRDFDDAEGRQVARALEWLRDPSQRFIRFGAFGEGPSKVGLDSEFVVTRAGGLYDPHMEEAGGQRPASYESGLSVYFARPTADGTGWSLEDPARNRASYHLGSGYMKHMAKVLARAICAGEVYLVKGRLIEVPGFAYDRDADEDVPTGLPTYDVGSDGEPVIEDAEIVTRLDFWGDEPGLPKLYYPAYPDDPYYLRYRIELRDYLGWKDRDETCDRYAPETIEKNPSQLAPSRHTRRTLVRRRRRNLVDDIMPSYRHGDTFTPAEPPATDQDVIFNTIIKSNTFVNPSRVPSNEWLLHLSRRKFERFTQGRHLDQLEIETALGMSGIGASPAMCDAADRPFLVQFAWSVRDIVYAPHAYTGEGDGSKRTAGSWRLVYGGPWQPAVLFRTMSGVRAYHGAERWQVVFRSCSEMDVIPIEAKHGGYRTQTGETFDRLVDLIDWANTRSSGPPMEWDLPVPGRLRTVEEVYAWLDGHVDTRGRRSIERFSSERAISESASEAEAVHKINDMMRI